MVELAAAVREQEKEQEYLGMQIYFPEKRFTEFIRLRRFLSLHSQGLNDIGKKHLKVLFYKPKPTLKREERGRRKSPFDLIV